MKKVFAIAVLMLSCSMAFGWNCSTAGQVRVQVPNGTLGNGTGDGSGQVVVDSGLTFICEALPVATTTPPSATSSSASTSGANSSSTSGANSTATGGNSSSKSGVTNSGNSTNTLNNTNTLSNKQGQKQTQTQSNASTNNNASSATSNGDNSNNSTEVTNIKPAAESAVAPIGFPTAPCLATFGAAAQSVPGGISFGGSRVDKGCDSRATAQQFALLLGNRTAAAKILCSTKAARRAHLTMDDCLVMPAPQPVTPVVIAAPVAAPVAPVQVTVNMPPTPQAQLIYLSPREEVTVTAPKPLGDAKPKAKTHVSKPCKITPALQEK